MPTSHRAAQSIRVARYLACALSTVLLGACVTAGDSRPDEERQGDKARQEAAAQKANQDDRLVNDVLAAARKVTWEKKNFSGYSFVYDGSARLMWATGLDRVANFANAAAWAGQLSIDGLDGWRLPTHREYLSSGVFPRNVKCNNRSAYINEVYRGSGWTSTVFEYDNQKAYLINYSVGSCGRLDEWEDYLSHEHRIYAVHSIDELTSILVNPRMSAEAQLVAVAKVLLRKKLQYTRTAITPPSEPERVQPQSLKRGEFEPAADFEKRQQQEKGRVDAETKRRAGAYEQAVRDFKARSAAEEQRQAAWNASLKTTATRQSLAEQALSEAFNLVFGSPTLKNVQYNPDKQAFDALLGSSRPSILAATAAQVALLRDPGASGFSKKGDYQSREEVAAPPMAAQKWTMQLSIPTPMKDAPAFKARLLDARLIPRLSFNWDSQQSKLSFASYEIITNEVKQQRDFTSAKQTNTINAYQDFVDRYPKAPQAAQAKQAIKDIQARQERERQEQIARQKAEEKQRKVDEAVAQAAAREREHKGCDNFYPGKTGKITGTSFWFSTVDDYIVRYVNKNKQMVTIQGTPGGVTLKDGQFHEISCANLIDSTRW